MLEVLVPSAPVHGGPKQPYTAVRRSDHVLQLSLSEVTVGRLLGTGAFCNVYVASASSIGTEGSAIKLAKKCRATPDEQNNFRLAIEDMKNEAAILSTLSHNNIIQLEAISCNDDEAEVYFLIVNRLDDTLYDRINHWRDQARARPFARCSSKDLSKRLEDVAIGIAKGLEYLHKKGIVHRDIKPQNIGFDNLDTPVLFDFGLARRFQPNEKPDWQNYVQIPDFNESATSLLSIEGGEGSLADSTAGELAHSTALTENTGFAGTPRYMAPEIARGEPYGASADVYSFALVLWELATLKCPYQRHKSFETLDAKVFNGTERPSTRNISNRSFSCLLKRAWTDSAISRPPIGWVLTELSKTIQELSEPQEGPQFLKKFELLKSRSARLLHHSPRMGKTSRRHSAAS